MRILFVSNYYPPLANGGYEQLCQEVAVELTTRGHDVAVLTSRSQDGPSTRDDDDVRVHSMMHLEVVAGLLETTARRVRHRAQLIQENLDYLGRLVAEFKPDAALIWGMWNVPRSVPAEVERLLPGRTAYYLCDYWPSLPSAYLQQWQAPATRPIAGFAKHVLSVPVQALLANEALVPLQLEHPICVSPAVRDILVQAGVRIEGSRIVNNGIRLGDFPFRYRSIPNNHTGELKLLYAGRVAPEKGVHTAIRALAMVPACSHASITLDIVGTGDARYERQLKALVQQERLDGRVTFRGRVPRTDMPSVLAEYDALLFPSDWDEPLARIVMEAMAIGLIVIATITGGTGEALEHGKTGLTFPRGDAKALATQIQRLIEQPALRRRLAKAARQRVVTRFTFMRMANQIEAELQNLAERPTK